MIPPIPDCEGLTAEAVEVDSPTRDESTEADPSEAAPSDQKDSNPYMAIYERDGWCCTYPGCSVRAMLHPHHLEFRSKFGSKSKAVCEDPSNITTLCYFHHALAHQEIIKVKGKAPLDLKWTKPTLVDVERKRRERQAEERQRKKRTRRPEEPGEKTVDDPRYTWVEGLGPTLVVGDEAA